MENTLDVLRFMYGDVKSSDGFWYSHLLNEVSDLSDDQLFWKPDENGLCILWHLGHIAHREKVHIDILIQGKKSAAIPSQYAVFGVDWKSTEEIKESIDNVDNVMSWIKSVRDNSQSYIKQLKLDDLSRKSKHDGLSIGHWLFITTAHTALHIGKIQILRAMLLNDKDNPC